MSLPLQIADGNDAKEIVTAEQRKNLEIPTFLRDEDAELDYRDLQRINDMAYEMQKYEESRYQRANDDYSSVRGN